MAEIKKPRKKVKKIKLRKNVGELDLPKQGKLRAVAVKYDIKKDKAPKIIAIGRGNIAEKILKIAEENRVPLYEDETLTQLLSKLEIKSEIPPELYTMVAEILAFVYQLDRLAKKRKQIQSKAKKNKAADKRS